MLDPNQIGQGGDVNEEQRELLDFYWKIPHIPKKKRKQKTGTMGKKSKSCGGIALSIVGLFLALAGIAIFAQLLFSSFGVPLW